MRAYLLHHARELCGRRLLCEDACRYTHRIEERLGEPPLQEMLRLVVQSRLTAPADDEDARDAVDRAVEEREQGIDDVPQPAVLEINDRRFSRCEMIARRERRSVSLARSDHVGCIIAAVALYEVIDKRPEL